MPNERSGHQSAEKVRLEWNSIGETIVCKLNWRRGRRCRCCCSSCASCCVAFRPSMCSSKPCPWYECGWTLIFDRVGWGGTKPWCSIAVGFYLTFWMIWKVAKIGQNSAPFAKKEEESKASVNHHERLRIVTKVQQPVAALLHLSISSVVRKIFFVQYMEGQMISRICPGNDVMLLLVFQVSFSFPSPFFNSITFNNNL